MGSNSIRILLDWKPSEEYGTTLWMKGFERNWQMAVRTTSNERQQLFASIMLFGLDYQSFHKLSWTAQTFVTLVYWS
jgi:hypothetical protein